MRKPAPDNVTFSPAGTYTVPAGTTASIEVQPGRYQFMGVPPNRFLVFVPTPGTQPVPATVNANGTWTAANYTNLTPNTTYAFRVRMTSNPVPPGGGTNEAMIQFTTPP